jgi:hypothetical protein
MKGTVGIKEANGNFYPIVEVYSSAKKRLLLTTAHDNQTSVQIDLYKSSVKSMKDAFYIGSIVVENIAQKPKGKASIEMILASTIEGTISVDVTETDNPLNKYHLTISLNSMEEDKRKYPDFDAGEGLKNKAQVKREKQEWSHRRKFPWLALAIGAVLLALLLLLLWFFLFKGGASKVQRLVSGLTSPGKTTTSRPDTGKNASPFDDPVIIERPPEPPPTPPEPPAPEKPKAAETAKSAEEPKAKGTSADTGTAAGSKRTANRINAPATIPPEGVIYNVRWGDTLWDISAAYYRNPRLYSFIARSNGITNPNRIISGTELKILPRN